MEDYLALPDDQRAELIDGAFYTMDTPHLAHQDICFRLGHLFQNYIEEKNGTCRVLISPVSVQLDRDDKTVVEPDLCIVCDPSRLLEGPRLMGAPDLVIEILSKSTKKKDLTLKQSKYCSAGVREYWAVDPAKLQIIVIRNSEEGPDYAIYSFQAKVPVGIYDGDLKFDFQRVYDKIQGMYGVGTDLNR